MTVQEDFVWGEGYGNGSKADDERCNMMIGGLNSLIHFADQQYFSSMTDTYTDYILDFLASQGVDTSREFVINGTHCELVNGKIHEVGNDYVVPSAIQQNFYSVHCRCTGAYKENNLWQDFKAVTVIIDPSTGKLIDIENFNYYYDYAVGSNSLTFTRRYPSMTLYKYGN